MIFNRKVGNLIGLVSTFGWCDEASNLNYPSTMNVKLGPFVFLIVVCFLLTPRLRAQEDAANDSDLAKMLKEAEQMQNEAKDTQKKDPPAPGAKKKLAEMEAEAKAEAARQEQEEKEEKAKLQAALKKQLDAPGPVGLPNWTPTTPQFTAAGSPMKKIIDDEVRIIVTGTSPLTPKELADGWETAAADSKNSITFGTTSAATAISPPSCSSARAPIPCKKWSWTPGARPEKRSAESKSPRRCLNQRKRASDYRATRLTR